MCTKVPQVCIIVQLCLHIVFCPSVTFISFSFLDTEKTKTLSHIRFETRWSIRSLSLSFPHLPHLTHSLDLYKRAKHKG